MSKLKTRVSITSIALMVFGALALCMMPNSATKAFADIEGNYTYMVSGGKATITDCVNDPTGAVTIPNKLGGYPVKAIGEHAFWFESGLTNIVLPDTVESIGEDAFFDCTNLKTIKLPTSLKNIGENAFFGCDSLTSVSIPSSLTKIDKKAFYNSGLVSVIVPSTANTIGEGAFGSCSNLSKVIIQSGVTKIEYDAFSVCNNLKSIAIPTSVKDISFYAGKFHKDVIVTLEYGSAAFEWAHSNGYKMAFTSSMDLSGSKVASISAKTYTGKPLKPTPKVTFKGKTLVEGTDYKLVYADNKNAGKATVTVKGIGYFKGSKKLKFTIKKADQKLKSIKTYGECEQGNIQQKPATYKIGAKALGNAKVKYAVSKYLSSETVSAANAKKYLKLDKSTGKVSILKGATKGVYSMKVKITAEATSNYKSKSVTKTVKFKVKFKNPVISNRSVTMGQGTSKKLSVSGGYGAIKWSSSNPAVASVNYLGAVYARSTGRCNIYAVRNGVTMKCSIWVKENRFATSTNITVNSARYGTPQMFVKSVRYSGSNVIADIYVVNNRMFTADYFDYVKIELQCNYFDDNGKYQTQVFARKTFGKTHIGLGRYAMKTMTFTFPALKKLDLTRTDMMYIAYDYYYHYTI